MKIVRKVEWLTYFDISVAVNAAEIMVLKLNRFDLIARLQNLRSQYTYEISRKLVVGFVYLWQKKNYHSFLGQKQYDK